MWLQGLYNFAAVSTALGNTLRRKGERPREYLSEPIRLIPYTEAELKYREEKERKKAIAYFDKLQKQWSKDAKCPSAKCREEALA